jgi:uncharacterized protein YbjQ (UPF0145 family)
MSVIIVNTDRIAHYTIKEYRGLVTAHQVVGANLLADMFASFTDVVGGNSGAYRERLDALYKDVKNQLSDKATSLGANAIVSFRIDFDEISGKNKSMFMVTSIGTAVVIEPDRFEIYDKLHSLNMYLKDGILTQEQYNFEREQIEKSNENFLATDMKRRAELLAEEQQDKAAEERKQRIMMSKKDILAEKFENIWMLSVERILSAEMPYTLKGNSMDEVIINLIAEDRFNEAGKYYMEETGLDAESAYDYIYKLFE